LVVNEAAIRSGLVFTLSPMVDEFLDEQLYSAALSFELLRDKLKQLPTRYNLQATHALACLSSCSMIRPVSHGLGSKFLRRSFCPRAMCCWECLSGGSRS
jgi:hypothetical protein